MTDLDQRLWLYNGAPLVAFYDTLGIRRTYSRLKPAASSRGFWTLCISLDLVYNYNLDFLYARLSILDMSGVATKGPLSLAR